MGRKSIKNEAIDTLWDTAYLTGFLTGSALAANIWWQTEIDLTVPLVAGPTLIFAQKYLNRLPRPRPSFALTTGRVAGGRAIRNNRKDTWFFSTVKTFFSDTKTARVKTRYEPVGEFYWDVPVPQRKYPVQVLETELYSFCSIVYGRRNTPHPLSRNYFFRELDYRPRTRYFACVELLRVTGLLGGLRQGASAGLRYPPTQTVSRAKNRTCMVGDDPHGRTSRDKSEQVQASDTSYLRSNEGYVPI